MKKSDGWTRNQLLVALQVYNQTPFGRLHRLNPDIIALAAKIGRTPSSLAMKTTNFANLDPTCERKGLSNSSQADRELWAEFTLNPDAVAVEAKSEYEKVSGSIPLKEPKEVVIPTGETEVLRTVKARKVQSFFREAVLVSYESRCAISGISLPELLVASHIIPWRESNERRADPYNGLCLSSHFDRAFDCGLISIDENHRVIASERLTKAIPKFDLHCSLLEAIGRQIRLPWRYKPDQVALAFHRKNVFGKTS